MAHSKVVGVTRLGSVLSWGKHTCKKHTDWVPALDQQFMRHTLSIRWKISGHLSPRLAVV